MTIAVPSNPVALVHRADAIQKLAASGLTRDDIEAVTGFGRDAIEAVLGPAPCVEARGPLSAEEVSTITGMPLSAARLMVR